MIDSVVLRILNEQGIDAQILRWKASCGYEQGNRKTQGNERRQLSTALRSRAVSDGCSPATLFVSPGSVLKSYSSVPWPLALTSSFHCPSRTARFGERSLGCFGYEKNFSFRPYSHIIGRSRYSNGRPSNASDRSIPSNDTSSGSLAPAIFTRLGSTTTPPKIVFCRV